MKVLKIGGLALVIASSLLLSGCGCGNAKTTEKEVATATETKDTKENKIDEKVSNETQVASGETKTEEVKEDIKDNKGTEEKSGNTGSSSSGGSTSSNSNSGSTGNSGSGNSGNSGNHSGNGSTGNSGNSSNGGNSGNSGNTGSTSHTPTPSPSNGGGGGNSNSSGGSSSTTPTHTHNWIPITQTIHHPAETRQEDQGHYETIVDQAAYDEEVPIMERDTYCLTCYNRGSIVRLHGQEEVNNHIQYHHNIGDSVCQYAAKTLQTGTEVIHHDAVTHQEWVSNIVTVTVKEAWDEVVTVGYQCSECGATK